MSVGDFVKGREDVNQWLQIAEIPAALALLWIGLAAPQHLDHLCRKTWRITVASNKAHDLSIFRMGDTYALLHKRN